MVNTDGDSPNANRRRALKAWLDHNQANRRIQQVKGKRVGRAPGSMRRYEDGSVGSTDKMPRRQREWPKGKRWV